MNVRACVLAALALLVACAPDPGADLPADPAPEAGAPPALPGSAMEPPSIDGGSSARDASPGDAQSAPSDAGGASADASRMCRTSGPCTDDAQCCHYCHDGDHCH